MKSDPDEIHVHIAPCFTGRYHATVTRGLSIGCELLATTIPTKPNGHETTGKARAAVLQILKETEHAGL